MRGADLKVSRRNGTIKSFTLNGKLGRDTPVTAEMRGRASGGQGREVIYLETNDAGAFFRFTDTYSKMIGGQLALAMDPPTTEPRATEGLINVRDFTIKGEASLDRVAAGGAGRTAERRRRSRGCARNSPGKTASGRSAKAS